MNKDVIFVKIDSLKRCIDRIIEKKPAGVEQLAGNLDIQDIIVLNLERAIQNAVDIAAHVCTSLKTPVPQTMSEAFQRLHVEKIISAHTALRMQKAVSFRNIAVHEYQLIDWQIVYVIITRHLDDFKLFVREILEWLQTQPTQPTQ